MRSGRGACARLTGLLALLALAGRVAAQTGDSLCDARQSTVDTCVIAADATLPDGGVLTFTKPNLRVRSNLTFGHCAPDPALQRSFLPSVRPLAVPETGHLSWIFGHLRWPSSSCVGTDRAPTRGASDG